MKGPEIARRRMRNSRLTGAGFGPPDEAVRWHLAMQAQDYGPAKWSIGQRSAGLVDADIDRALAAGSIVRTHVLRPTWHLVAGDDIRWLLALSGPRVQQHIGPRLRRLGLDERTLARAGRLIASALEGGNRLTRDGIAAVLDDARIDRAGQRLPHILMHGELEALICSGGLSGKQHTYALLDEQVPHGGRRLGRDEALLELTRRYLTSHGPASAEDLSWWSGLTIRDVRKARDMLGPKVRDDMVGDVTVWSIASDREPPPPARGVDLLQTYDELVVGYRETRFLGDPGAEIAREAWTGRTFPSGVALINGRIGGHWRRTFEGDSIRVEVYLYGEQTSARTKALEAAASKLGRFLARSVTLDVRQVRPAGSSA